MPCEKVTATGLLNLTTSQTMCASPNKYMNQTTVFAIPTLQDYRMPYIAI